MSEELRLVVRKFVLPLLASHTDIPIGKIRDTDRLAKDIRLDGDEFSFIVHPALDSHFGVRTLPHEWNSVATVGDMVELYVRRVAELTASEEAPEHRK